MPVPDFTLSFVALLEMLDLDELPPMTADMRRRITLSASDDARTVFDTNSPLPTDPSR